MKLTIDRNLFFLPFLFDRRAQKFALAAALVACVPAFAQTGFTAGNLVVLVEGCGVHAGTCKSVPYGTGTGAGNSSGGGYGDNQASPLTLFQYSPAGTSSAAFVNSLVLPQTGSGANLPVSSEYGSSSEGSLQLSGSGQYLTFMGYGINAAQFNAAYQPGFTTDPFGAAPSGALAQSGSLTGQSYTAVPRVVTLVDANGNVNSSTALYNVFSTNNPRSIYTANGATAYVSGQGSGSDLTGGVFYTAIGAPNTAPTAITGGDANSNTIGQDTRAVQIFNNTLYAAIDTKEGSGSNRDYIGTLGTIGTPAVTTVGAPVELTGFGNSGGTGKVTIGSGGSSIGNNLNAGMTINLSPVNFFFASPTVLYVADGGRPKNDSNGDNNSNGTANIGNGGLQKWVNTAGTWSLKYTLYQGLNLVNNGGTSGTTGLYGLAGKVTGATVQLYATSYTINDLDPTYLYGITDTLANTTPPGTSLAFTLLDTAPADSNFKGVSFAPTIPAGDVEITSVPSGLTVTSAGTGCAPGSYAAPVTLSWTPASSCQLSVVSPQSGTTGGQFTFSHWQDLNIATTDMVTAPPTTATYTATFSQTQVDVSTLIVNSGFEFGLQPAPPGDLGIGCPLLWTCLGSPYTGASSYLVTSAQYLAGADGLTGSKIVPGGLYAATLPVPVGGSGRLYQLGLGTYQANTTYDLTLWIGTPLTVPFCGSPASPGCVANVTPAGPLENLRFYWLGSGSGTSLNQLKAINLPIPPAGQWTSTTVTYNPSMDLVNGLPQGIGEPIGFVIFAADNYSNEIVNIDIVPPAPAQ
jgi:hypothetical protein